MMRNLEQIRAQNAFAASGDILPGAGGSRMIAKKVPAQIITNGFLGALAFAIENAANKDGTIDEKKGGYYSVFQAIVTHLRTKELNLGIKADNPVDLFTELSGKDTSAATLRAITAEAMAYLNYLRRFAKPGKEDEQ